MTIYLCISSRNDPAFPLLQQLLSDFPGYHAKILVENEDPNLSGQGGDADNLGPNPKIRNMSRGYREAKGDIIWILDCNVWVSRSVCGNMVDRLCGFTRDGRKYKFVHQLPLVVDVSESISPSRATHDLRGWGSALEELFLSTSHAKFYTAISAVAVAPCIVGKSNMFRRSHLNALTSEGRFSAGIDFFSNNICEDHLIGDLLWKRPIPPNVMSAAALEGLGKASEQQTWGNHAILHHSLAIQPMAHLPLRTFLDRRTRWLRVRKFTVPLATFVEPGTESLLCSLYGAYALSYFDFLSFGAALGISILGWMLVDWHLWHVLQSGATYGDDEGEPAFAQRTQRRKSWWMDRVVAWIGREALAFGIWVWAVIGGVEVVWRGRRFWVGWDASVSEIDGEESRATWRVNGSGNGRVIQKLK